jgi:hypothetical protein
VAGVGASFDWFCLNARLATLVDMPEEDAEALCGQRPRPRREKIGQQLGQDKKGKVAFRAGRWI